MDNTEFQKKFNANYAMLDNWYGTHRPEVHKGFWESVRSSVLIPTTKEFIRNLSKDEFGSQARLGEEIGVSASTINDGISKGSMNLSRFHSLTMLAPFDIRNRLEEFLPSIRHAMQLVSQGLTVNLTPLNESITNYLRIVTVGWNQIFRSQPPQLTRQRELGRFASKCGLAQTHDELDQLTISWGPVYKVVRDNILWRLELVGNGDSP